MSLMVMKVYSAEFKADAVALHPRLNCAEQVLAAVLHLFKAGAPKSGT
ncbi:hypothetical protein M2271_003020 [Streptomyces sp. LBL]|nr:hypothetical protein [Streptomyces sp. LBL]